MFPLVGGGSTPASPSTMFSGFSLIDDTEYVILNSPFSAKKSDRSSNYDDEDKTSNITVNEESTPPDGTPRLRQNSSPTTMNSFKNTLRMGILAEWIYK